MKDSEFQFRECRYKGDHQLEVTVEHEKYGTLTADVEIELWPLTTPPPMPGSGSTISPLRTTSWANCWYGSWVPGSS